MRILFADLIRELSDKGLLSVTGEKMRLTPAADYFNNILPLLFSPDSFTEALLSLPEEYLEIFPVPKMMVGIGITQSTPWILKTGKCPDHPTK